MLPWDVLVGGGDTVGTGRVSRGSGSEFAAVEESRCHEE